MIKSKSMAVAAATLAMCVAGSAFAQDRRYDPSPERGEHYSHQPYRPYQQQPYQQQPRQGGHESFRGDAYRSHQAHPHTDWRRGGRVPSEYRGRNYVVNDWRSHRLQAPPRGYQWVGVSGDYVLAAVATGLIAQIIVGQ